MHKFEVAIDMETGAVAAVTVQTMDGGDTASLPVTLSEPKRGRRNWKGKQLVQKATYGNRRRIRARRGKRLLQDIKSLLGHVRICLSAKGCDVFTFAARRRFENGCFFTLRPTTSVR